MTSRSPSAASRSGWRPPRSRPASPTPADPAVTSRWGSGDRPNADEYDARWRAKAAAGEDPHGEATFVAAFSPSSVLDAGCGTGRVAIELARRGIETCGVDL